VSPIDRDPTAASCLALFACLSTVNVRKNKSASRGQIYKHQRFFREYEPPYCSHEVAPVVREVEKRDGKWCYKVEKASVLVGHGRHAPVGRSSGNTTRTARQLPLLLMPQSFVGCASDTPPSLQRFLAIRGHVDDALALVLFLPRQRRSRLTLASSMHLRTITRLEFPNCSSAVLTNIRRTLLPATVYIANTTITTRALLTCTCSSCTFMFSPLASL
jgi:hypothetical protein